MTVIGVGALLSLLSSKRFWSYAGMLESADRQA